MASVRRFIPALRYHQLTPVYDIACRALGLGHGLRHFQLGLLDGTDPALVLEVGCGTGELLKYVARRFPGALLTGLDADEAVLARAERKLALEGVRPALVPGLAQQLPFADSSFDLVLSSLMLHHLDSESKLRALREWRRVLKPRGTLVLVDFGKPTTRLARWLTWPLRLNILEEQGDNFRGRIPGMLCEAGYDFEEAGRYGPLIVGWRASAARRG